MAFGRSSKPPCVIRVLPKDLANKIAAGEVVERPASVVKELVENAIDAKSRRIFVSLLGGGLKRIEVADDGAGMSREEALLAFKRHATSKISEAADLSAIMTLGFRGEALPSIASISKMRLTTKGLKGHEGTEIVLEGGSVKAVKASAAPQGATFEVCDLFYNVPARRKFMKSEQTELGHVRRMLFLLALSCPHIHFRLQHGGRTLLEAPSTPTFEARAGQLLGESMAANAQSVSAESPVQKGLSLSAFLARPPLKRNYKREQYLFVNHRPIKSPLLSHAVYEAYGSYLMKGEEPFFVLFLHIDPQEVDVNVHPAKREVRFRNANQVHQAVRNLLREALSKSLEGRFNPSALPHPEEALQTPFQAPTSAKRETGLWVGWPEVSGPRPRSWPESGLREPLQGQADSAAILSVPGRPPADEGPRLFSGEKAPFIRAIGQVYETFLLAEVDGVLVLADQHTAHERILYERFLEAWPRPGLPKGEKLEIQPLLIPQQIDLSPRQAHILKEHLEPLEAVGCRLEPFGESAFLVREAPALVSRMHFEPFLCELADELDELGISAKAEQPIKTILASMACHAAVRASQSMSLPEIESLLTQYFARKAPPTCPHGRPIVVRYPLSDLEKLFRRK